MYAALDNRLRMLERDASRSTIATNKLIPTRIVKAVAKMNIEKKDASFVLACCGNAFTRAQRSFLESQSRESLLCAKKAIAL